jgi:hypothetical protein
MTDSMKKRIIDIKAFNKQYYGTCKGSNTDYETVYKDFCRNDGDWTASRLTKLYHDYSSEYCGLLSVLESVYTDHREPAKYRIMQSGAILNEKQLERSYMNERADYYPIPRFVRWLSDCIDSGLIERVYAESR